MRPQAEAIPTRVVVYSGDSDFGLMVHQRWPQPFHQLNLPSVQSQLNHHRQNSRHSRGLYSFEILREASVCCARSRVKTKCRELTRGISVLTMEAVLPAIIMPVSPPMTMVSPRSDVDSRHNHHSPAWRGLRRGATHHCDSGKNYYT